MKRRPPDENSTFKVAHFRRPVEGNRSHSQERVEDLLRLFPPRSLNEGLANDQDQSSDTVDVSLEQTSTVILDENKKKPQNRGDMTRNASILNLSHQYNQAANKCCSTEAERSQFFTDFVKEVLKGMPTMPDVASELFKNRDNKNEKAPDFIMRVYGPWLGNGLTQPDIYRLDKPLYVALHNWLRKNPMPKGLDLPSKHEALSRELAAQDPDNLRDKSRLSVARWRREKRNL